MSMKKIILLFGMMLGLGFISSSSFAGMSNSCKSGCSTQQQQTDVILGQVVGDSYSVTCVYYVYRISDGLIVSSYVKQYGTIMFRGCPTS